MKRFFVLLSAALMCLGMGAATVETEKWTGSEPVSWNGDIPGTQFETPSGIFSGLEEGDIIKVYTSVTGADYGDPQYVLTYKAGDNWTWTDLAVSVDDDGVISYTVESATVATEIADRGLVFRGQNWTATKITVTKEETTPEPEVTAFSLDNFTADDGNSYDATTYTLTVTTAWSGGQLWIGENSTYSGSKLVIKTTEDRKLKVLVGYVGGGEVDMMDSEATKTHTLETDNTKKIEKVIIQNQGATAVTFESMELDPEEDPEPEVTYEDVTLFEGETATGNWETHVDLAWGACAELANAQMNDIIRITYTFNDEGAVVRVADPSGWEAIGDGAEESVTESGSFSYTINSAKILEIVQGRGILGRGKNITITKIELRKASNRYDAVSVTIGTEGVATFSSSKALDFTDTGVTPYVASSFDPGVVCLKSLTKTHSWRGLIVKGAPDTYNIPVITDDDAEDPTDYLQAHVGEGSVAASTEGTYRYIFAKDKLDDTKIGFFKLTSDYTLAAHRAYLETDREIAPSGDSNARLVLRFEDDPTAISEVKSATQPVKADNVYYNLNGQRVEKPTKGIYILNGKKVLF